jgi:cellulose synthase operon protein B
MRLKIILCAILITCFISGFSPPLSGYAQAQLMQVLPEQSQDIEFSKIGLVTDSVLNGSFEELKLVFSLPSSWELKPGGVINLNISNYFANLIAGQTAGIPSNMVVGELSVWLNGSKVGSLPLKDSGDFSYSINLDEKSFQNQAHPGLNELLFRWDASVSCGNDVASTVTILPSSKLHLQYQVYAILPDLNQFPGPFFQDRLIQLQKLTILVPGQPSEAELQSALTVAAGFGKFSKGAMTIGLLPYDQLGKEDISGNNLIVVGTLANLGKINDAAFEGAVASQITSLDSSDEEGVVMGFSSPWNTGSVLLIVTGKSDSGVIKAATAVSSGNLASSSEKNIVRVKEIVQNGPQAEKKDDVLFSELDQQTIEITNYGQERLEIPFTISKNGLFSSEAYLDLYINHSKLIDYNQSGLWVSINGLPIGSVRFSDQTSETTLARFIIPPSALKSIFNKIEIETNLISRNLCVNPGVSDHWITIFGDSYIHIPTSQVSSKWKILSSIGDYPQPFAFDEGLSSTTFVIEKDDLQSWKTAAALAFDLGAEMQSGNYHFSVHFADGFNLGSSQDQNLVIIGLANRIPFTTKVNDWLPVPFNPDGSLRDISKLKIVYDVINGQPLGFLQLFNPPAYPQSEVLLILGTNADGLTKAGLALLDAEKRSQMLQSNFVLIQDEKLLPDLISVKPADQSQAGTIGPVKTPQPVAENIRQWTWAGLISILILIFILIAVSIWQAYKNRVLQKKQLLLSQKHQKKP